MGFGQIIAILGIIASIVMLCYGGYVMFSAPQNNFWQSLGMNLYGMLTFWAWVPVLIGCVGYLHFERDWNKMEIRMEQRRKNFFGPSGDRWD